MTEELKRGSPTNYARHRKRLGLPGATQQTVRKQIEAGKITYMKGTCVLDFAACDVAWKENNHETHGGTRVRNERAHDTRVMTREDDDLDEVARRAAAAAPAPDGISYAESHRRREFWTAELKRLEALKAAGDLVAVSELRVLWADIFATMQSRGLSLPDRHATAIAAKARTAEGDTEAIAIVRGLLDAMIREYLTGVPDAVVLPTR